MDGEVDLLSHHPKKSYKASQSVSATAQRLYGTLARLMEVGFSVDADGQRLKVAPATLLTASQRGWIRDHKAALVAAVSAPCWRWCIEYPRDAVAADSGRRCVADYVPDADWRTVSSDYPGAAVWPTPDDLDVADWIDGMTPRSDAA